MKVNDVVLIGCPGTDLAHSAADFHVNGGQVYVGAASTDPVARLGMGGPGAAQWLNTELGNPLGPVAGLGTDPSAEGFGATRFRAERGDDITGVADNEKLSGILLSNEFWHQAAIGTGDEKRFRILAGCQAAKEFLALRENLFLEVEEALNDMLHSSVSFLCLSRL